MGFPLPLLKMKRNWPASCLSFASLFLAVLVDHKTKQIKQNHHLHLHPHLTYSPTSWHSSTLSFWHSSADWPLTLYWLFLYAYAYFLLIIIMLAPFQIAYASFASLVVALKQNHHLDLRPHLTYSPASWHSSTLSFWHSSTDWPLTLYWLFFYAYAYFLLIIMMLAPFRIAYAYFLLLITLGPFPISY